jgi:membrane-bound serine protease (ClpP class)
MRHYFILSVFLCAFLSGYAERKTVYVIPLQQEINMSAARIVRKGLLEAHRQQSDYVLLHLDTYGGEVRAADTIRRALMYCNLPVIVFIDNQAASAGALIALACDSIYMRSGGSIGAATVVNQTGDVLPEKQQAFMRKMMRATAESHGKQSVWNGRDSVEVWRRDPLIAEAMVDLRIVVPGVIDSTRVLAFTVDEAMANGYCEGKAETIAEVLERAGLAPATIKEYRPSWLDTIILFLMNPLLQGLLMMLMIGGIYFELQTPGVGFPLIAAATGALLYFAPLYLEGLAENWELVVFVAGLILLAIEIFVLPGFGVAGILGALLCLTGLVLAMIDNHLFSTPEGINLTPLVKPLFVVSAGVFGGLVGCIYLTRKLYSTRIFGRIALKTDLTETDGYVGVPVGWGELTGATGTAHTALRPSGKIEINGDIYDAVAEEGMIERGRPVKVTRYETGQLYCRRVD